MHTGDKQVSEGPVCKCMDCARFREERRLNSLSVEELLKELAAAQGPGDALIISGFETND